MPPILTYSSIIKEIITIFKKGKMGSVRTSPTAVIKPPIKSAQNKNTKVYLNGDFTTNMSILRFVLSVTCLIPE